MNRKKNKINQKELKEKEEMKSNKKKELKIEW